MERDFLGLGSKNAPVTIKEQEFNRPNNSVSLRASSMQLSFSNKVSAVPQFLSFKAAVQEDSPRKAAHDPLVSSGFMKQGGNNYFMGPFGLQQFDGQPNQTITVSMITPLPQSHIISSGHNIIGNTLKPQPFAGVPIMAPPVSVVTPPSSMIGTTELRNGPQSFGAPSQLTVFYAGYVCVYDDVSPQKARSIMLLAGNGSSAAQGKMAPMTQAQTPIPQPSTADVSVVNNGCIMSPLSSIPSHLSVTSHVSLQPSRGPSGSNELTATTTIAALASASNQPEPPKFVNSVGSAVRTLIPADAVPQARKASLARFLEKRKERVTNTSPYSTSKRSPDSGSLGSDGISFCVTSTGANPLHANQ